MTSKSSNPPILSKGTEVDKFVIRKHIGHGGYGEIYTVLNRDDDNLYAMKTEMLSAPKQGLRDEINFLKGLRGCLFFPQIIAFGETSDFRWLTMELLGASLSQIVRILPSERLSKHTATYVAKGTLRAIQACHQRNIIHRDIKPANFLIRPNKDYPIVLIDFGLSRIYADESGTPLEPRERPGFIGTCAFASVHAQKGMELSKRDDLISWLYSIVYLIDYLPWPGRKNRAKTKEIKEHILPAKLFRKLPKQFIEIYNNVMNLSFFDEPDYNLYYSLLDQAYQELGGDKKHLDWEKLPASQVSKVSALPLVIPRDEKNNNKGLEVSSEPTHEKHKKVNHHTSHIEIRHSSQHEVAQQGKPEQHEAVKSQPAQREVVQAQIVKTTPHQRAESKHHSKKEGGCGACNIA